MSRYTCCNSILYLLRVSSTVMRTRSTLTSPSVNRLTTAEVDALRQDAKQALAKMDEILRARKG